MRRFKFGWALVALTLVAIGLAVLYRDWNREIEAGRSSTRAPSAQHNSRAAANSETGTIVKPVARVFPDFGQAGAVENPQPGKEPLRIKTH